MKKAKINLVVDTICRHLKNKNISIQVADVLENQIEIPDAKRGLNSVNAKKIQKGNMKIKSTIDSPFQKQGRRFDWDDLAKHKLVFLSQSGYPRDILEVVLCEKRRKELCFSKIQKHMDSLVKAAAVLIRKLRSDDGKTHISFNYAEINELKNYLEFTEGYCKFLHQLSNPINRDSNQVLNNGLFSIDKLCEKIQKQHTDYQLKMKNADYLNYLQILKEQSNHQELIAQYIPSFISQYVIDQRPGTIAGWVMVNMKLSKANARNVIESINREYSVHERNNIVKAKSPMILKFKSAPVKQLRKREKKQREKEIQLSGPLESALLEQSIKMPDLVVQELPNEDQKLQSPQEVTMAAQKCKDIRESMKVSLTLDSNWINPKDMVLTPDVDQTPRKFLKLRHQEIENLQKFMTDENPELEDFSQIKIDYSSEPGSKLSPVALEEDISKIFEDATLPLQPELKYQSLDEFSEDQNKNNYLSDHDKDDVVDSGDQNQHTTNLKTTNQKPRVFDQYKYFDKYMTNDAGPEITPLENLLTLNLANRNHFKSNVSNGNAIYSLIQSPLNQKEQQCPFTQSIRSQFDFFNLGENLVAPVDEANWLNDLPAARQPKPLQQMDSPQQFFLGYTTEESNLLYAQDQLKFWQDLST